MPTIDQNISQSNSDSEDSEEDGDDCPELFKVSRNSINTTKIFRSFDQSTIINNNPQEQSLLDVSQQYDLGNFLNELEKIEKKEELFLSSFQRDRDNLYTDDDQEHCTQNILETVKTDDNVSVIQSRFIKSEFLYVKQKIFVKKNTHSIIQAKASSNIKYESQLTKQSKLSKGESVELEADSSFDQGSSIESNGEIDDEDLEGSDEDVRFVKEGVNLSESMFITPRISERKYDVTSKQKRQALIAQLKIKNSKTPKLIQTLLGDQQALRNGAYDNVIFKIKHRVYNQLKNCTNTDDKKIIRKLLQDVEILEKKPLLNDTEFKVASKLQNPKSHKLTVSGSHESKFIDQRLAVSSMNNSLCIEKLFKKLKVSTKDPDWKSVGVNGEETYITFKTSVAQNIIQQANHDVIWWQPYPIERVQINPTYIQTLILKKIYGHKTKDIFKLKLDGFESKQIREIRNLTELILLPTTRNIQLSDGSKIVKILCRRNKRVLRTTKMLYSDNKKLGLAENIIQHDDGLMCTKRGEIFNPDNNFYQQRQMIFTESDYIVILPTREDLNDYNTHFEKVSYKCHIPRRLVDFSKLRNRYSYFKKYHSITKDLYGFVNSKRTIDIFLPVWKSENGHRVHLIIENEGQDIIFANFDYKKFKTFKDIIVFDKDENQTDISRETLVLLERNSVLIVWKRVYTIEDESNQELLPVRSYTFNQVNQGNSRKVFEKFEYNCARISLYMVAEDGLI